MSRILPSGNLVSFEVGYRQNTHSFRISYMSRLLAFRKSSEIDGMSYEWRQLLDIEIEDLDNEINPITIKDFNKH